MLWKRIVIRDQERVLVAKNGRFNTILVPGSYVLFNWPGISLNLEKFNTRDLVFQSKWTDYLLKERPDIVGRHFALVETNEFQVAMIYADGALFKVLTPSKQVLFWRETVVITAEIVDVVVEPAFAIAEYRSSH